MDIEQQAETQPTRAAFGQHPVIVRRQEIRNSLDFNDHLSIHEDARAKAFVDRTPL